MNFGEGREEGVRRYFERITEAHLSLYLSFVSVREGDQDGAQRGEGEKGKREKKDRPYAGLGLSFSYYSLKHPSSHVGKREKEKSEKKEIEEERINKIKRKKRQC